MAQPSTLAAADYVAAASRGHRHPVGDMVVKPKILRKQAAAGIGSVGDVDPFSEIGTTGLRQFGGFVLEEWLTQLQGRKAAWQWREMLDNDPTVGAIMFAIRWLASGVEWRVDEGNKPADAEFVEQCMHDMSHTWGDFISEALGFLGYGWGYHEITYKRRRGPVMDRFNPSEARGDGTTEDDQDQANSAYKDGKIGWRKLPIRAQETLLRWHFDGYSGIQAMEQIDYHGGDHIIPVEKSLLFRTQTTRNNPEGRSILRNAYTSYFSLKNIKALEAIGIERDLAGIPVLTPPANVNLFQEGQEALLAKCQALVSSIRRDEYEGVLLPSADWVLQLLSSGGSRQIDTDAIIRRYRQDMATSMLADFVLIGQDAVGSYAMVDVKSDLFGIALDGILDLVCEIMNRYAIPRLLKLNGMDVSDPPQIAHGSAGRIDLQKVGQFLYWLSSANAPIPWSVELLKALFTEAGLPTNFEEQEKPDDLPAAPDKPDPQHEFPPGIRPSDDSAAPAPQIVEQPPPGQEAGPPPGQPVSKAAKHAPDVAKVLQARHRVLSSQLEQEIHGALGELGHQASSAYMTLASKASGPNLHRIVGKVMQALNIRQWVISKLLPLLQNHAGRVMADTVRTVQTEIGLEVGIGEQQAQKITALAGKQLGMRDIEPQVRQAITQAIRDGLAAGEHPVATARRIRDQVPAGRFTNAGPKYRAQLIARDQTANLQRESALAAYQSNPRITAVKLQDGIYGAPRSDAQCMARDGQVVPIDEAGSVAAYHPQCTLGLSPVVSTVDVPVDRHVPAMAA